MDSPDRDWEREPSVPLSKPQDDADALRAEVEKLRVTLAASERARLEDAADHGDDMTLMGTRVRALEASNARLQQALRAVLPLCLHHLMELEGSKNLIRDTERAIALAESALEE